MSEPNPNQATTDQWAGERAARWAMNWEVLDRQLTPVTAALMAAANPQPGERVLDVGCGTGPTTRLAAEAVGRRGSVVGVDVADEMLDVGRAVAIPDGAAPIEWARADATSWSGVGDPFDLVLSRFGVMFFADPDAAFANLRRLTAPTGRLCTATWQARSASPLFELPLAIVLSHCAAWGLHPDVPADDTGAFSLHETAVRALLERTGWHDVQTQAHDLALPAGGAATPVEAAKLSLEIGPARMVVDDLTDEQRDEIRAAVTVAYADHVDAEGLVHLGGGIVISTARP